MAIKLNVTILSGSFFWLAWECYSVLSESGPFCWHIFSFQKRNRSYKRKCCRVNFSLFFMVVSIMSSAEELVHFLRRPVEAVADVAESRLGGRSLEVQDTSELHCKKFSVRGWVYNNQAIFLRAPCPLSVTEVSFNFFRLIYDADSVLADATDLGETGKRRRMLKKPMRSRIVSTKKSPAIYTTCAEQQWAWIPK
jgi:hypothetical protein